MGSPQPQYDMNGEVGKQMLRKDAELADQGGL